METPCASIVYINVSELTKGFNGNTGFHVQTVFTANTIMHRIIINNKTTTFITKSQAIEPNVFIMEAITFSSRLCNICYELYC